MSLARSSQINVLLVEDHPAVRRALTLLLDGAGFRLREASTGRSALRQCLELAPDVVIIDITMPRLDGFACARQIAKIAPGASIIFLTTHACEEYERAAMRFGGAPLVLKKHAAIGLVDTIESVLQDRTCLRRAG